jgi:LysR family hydrogen peroxide-inducible transcriptional activator
MLTAVGEAVVARSRVMLREADEIRAIARRSKDPESGLLKLGIFPTLGPYLLPHIIPTMVSRYPKLELILVEEKTEVILRKLHDGELDCGILAMPIPEDNLHVEFLFEEDFVLAVPKLHPMAKQTKVKLTELAEEQLLLLDDGHCLRDQALEVCQMAGASERGGFRATSLETLRHMVAANAGITLMPALTVHPPSPVSPSIQLIRFADPAPYRRIALVWRRTSALAAFLHSLVPLIQNVPGELLHAPKLVK